MEIRIKSRTRNPYNNNYYCGLPLDAKALSTFPPSPSISTRRWSRSSADRVVSCSLVIAAKTCAASLIPSEVGRGSTFNRGFELNKPEELLRDRRLWTWFLMGLDPCCVESSVEQGG